MRMFLIVFTAIAVCGQVLCCRCDVISARSSTTIVDLTGIPNQWKSSVAVAVTENIIPQVSDFFIVYEEVDSSNNLWIIFSLYEDGPDAAHRLDTFKLDSEGRLYVLSVNEDVLWIPYSAE